MSRTPAGRWTEHAVRPRTVVLVVALAALAATLYVPLGLPANAGIRPRAVLAVDLFSAFSAYLVALLAFGRFVQSRHIHHALLAAAMTVLGTGAMTLSVLPAIDGDDTGGPFGPRLVTALFAAVLFAAATWVPPAEVPSRHPLGLLLLVTVVVVGAVVAVARLLPDLGSSVGSAETFGASGEPLPAVFQGVAALLFAAAAVGAVRRAGRDDDVLMGWLGAGAVLAVFSRIDFVLARSQDSTWVLTGLSFRLGFYLLLLGGAVQEIRWYWSRATAAAVLEERRRIARDLHDGLAQELAFIAAQSRMVAERPPSPRRAGLVAAAAQRALDESRRAIAALTRPLDEPLDVALAQEVEEVAGRLDAGVALDLESDIVVAPERREALLRIAREAVTNAVRHGHAQLLTVQLANHDGVSLRVSDDGDGFDLDAVADHAGRLGLVSMRERAESLGGRFELSSTPGCGTTVEVWLP